MSVQEHTPLPWISQEYGLYEEDGIAIIGLRTDSNGIPYDQPTNGIVAWVTLLPTEIEIFDSSRAEANAELIVRAVNAHAGLVKALIEAERFMAYFANETDGHFSGDGTPTTCLVEIRAALAAAGVKP